MGAAGDAVFRSESRELMSAADLGRTVSRIAHQIIEKTALDNADA
ncbi:MAG: bifunctional pyr operon transcriptional regulator/uracil phosphoribosyltransferase, partial [Mycobacterium sp.]